MTPEYPLIIDVAETHDTPAVGQAVPLRLLIRRPADSPGPVAIPFINHTDDRRVVLNTDLLQRDVTLYPGECLEVTVGVEFRTPGPANLCEFYVQADPTSGGSGTLVRLPDRPLRVVPSMRAEIEAAAERICAYDDAVKMEVTLRNVAGVAWEDFTVEVGPPGTVRAGVVRHRRPRLEPGQVERFEIVIRPGELELALAGTKAGERVEDRRTFPASMAADGPAGPPPFAFLEPRALTSDRVRVQATEGGPEIEPRRGVYAVTGGGQSYIVTIYPNDPAAGDVDLLAVPGKVEVESMKTEGRAWSFLVTTLSNPLMTQLVRLYYDVDVPGRVLRGELYLALQPSSGKLWAIAATGGAALTIKGLTGLLPVVLNPESLPGDLLPSALDLFRKSWTDWAQLASIPLLRLGLSALVEVARRVRGW